MKRIRIISILFFFLTSLHSAYSYQSSPEKIVIYNHFAYSVETRHLQVQPGVNEYSVDSLPASIEKESIFIEVSSEDILVLEQKFNTQVFDFYELLNNVYLGKTIELTLISGQSLRGAYYGQNLNDLILRNGETFSSVNRSRIELFSIDNITQVNPFRPELKIVIQSRISLNTDISVHYLVNHIGWVGEYTGMYEPESKELRVKSWARISNNTGSQFNTDVMVLVAGDPQRVRDKGPQLVRQSAMAMRDIPQQEQSAGFQRGESHIFHTYTLNRAINLAANSEQQILLFPEKLVRVDEKFIFSTATYGDKIINVLEFINDEETGIGEPIPAGILKLYQQSPSGSVFIGEDRIPDTPLNQRITIRSGTAFDLTGKRAQKQFRRIGERGREEVYEIAISNGGKEDREVTVREKLFGDWRIFDSSIEHTILDAQTAEFEVLVRTGNNFTFNYTARFN